MVLSNQGQKGKQHMFHAPSKPRLVAPAKTIMMPMYIYTCTKVSTCDKI